MSSVIEVVTVDGRLVARHCLYKKELTHSELLLEFSRLAEELERMRSAVANVHEDPQFRSAVAETDSGRVTFLDPRETAGFAPRNVSTQSDWYQNYWLRRQIRTLLLALEDKQEWEDRQPRGAESPTVEEKLLAFRELAARRLGQLHNLRKEYDQITKVLTTKNRLLEALHYPWSMQSGPWIDNRRYPDVERPKLTRQILVDMVHMMRSHVSNWNLRVKHYGEEGPEIDWNDPEFSRRLRS